MRIGRTKRTYTGGTPARVGKPGKPAIPATPAKVRPGMPHANYTPVRIIPGKPAVPAVPAVPATPAVPSTTVTESTQVQTPRGPSMAGPAMSAAVLFLGMGLIYANSLTDSSSTTLWGFLFDNTKFTSKSDLAKPLSMFMMVIIMAILADMSPAIGGISVLALTGFWVVWAVENPSGISTLIGKLSFGTSGTPTNTPALTTQQAQNAANVPNISNTPFTPGVSNKQAQGAVNV
jgi:hypothetical protein